APHLRALQRRLAKEITCMIHSQAEYDKAVEASNILFGKASLEALRSLDEETLLQIFEGVPQFHVSKSDLENGDVSFIDMFAEKSNIFPSKGELKRLIKGGGIAMNTQKVEDGDKKLTTEDLIASKYIIVQKGKKNYNLVIID
ncbi:MAG: tyrosine--tRNA ligase, partial [Rikenellaceae bacterium]